MNPEVQQAIEELKTAFAGHNVEAVPDGEGGAYVRVYDLPFGEQYAPASGWVTFRITHMYPHADIYPHHLPPGMTRLNGQPLGEALHAQEMNLGPFTGSTTTVSRKSNRWNPAQDTAAIKLRKVLDWVTSRT